MPSPIRSLTAAGPVGTGERSYGNRPDVGTLIVTTAAAEGALWQALAMLKGARQARGVSLGDVERRSGIDLATLSRLEDGQPLQVISPAGDLGQQVARQEVIVLVVLDQEYPDPLSVHHRPLPERGRRYLPPTAVEGPVGAQGIILHHQERKSWIEDWERGPP